MFLEIMLNANRVKPGDIKYLARGHWPDFFCEKVIDKQPLSFAGVLGGGGGGKGVGIRTQDRKQLSAKSKKQALGS